jgi:hypothetical protein
MWVALNQHEPPNIHVMLLFQQVRTVQRLLHKVMNLMSLMSEPIRQIEKKTTNN